MNKIRKKFMEALHEENYLGHLIGRSHIKYVCDKYDLKFPSWLVNSDEYRTGHGEYFIPDSIIEYGKNVVDIEDYQQPKEKEDDGDKKFMKEFDAVVPEVNKNFVAFDYYYDLKKIIESKVFLPVYLTGLSGVGKTEFVYQVFAELGRELFRFNFTEDTSEDALIGGFRLINGETVYYKGPILQAMQRGAGLLLDEGDQASPTVSMALQPILEGKPYFIKQTGETVVPKEGFNIILAANTKGKGDETGHFIGAQIQNEANLDRYVLTFEHSYPKTTIERRILKNYFVSNDLDIKHDFNKNLIQNLVAWAKDIRSAYHRGDETNVMTTRRLLHFVKTYAIFKDKKKTLDLILSRYDEETQETWRSLFMKIDKYYQAGNIDAYESELLKEKYEAELIIYNECEKYRDSEPVDSLHEIVKGTFEPKEKETEKVSDADKTMAEAIDDAIAKEEFPF